jgi:hypothetical protein
MGIERFEEIEAWQYARALTKEIYQISKDGPFGRDYGLGSQIHTARSNLPATAPRSGNTPLPAQKGLCVRRVEQAHEDQSLVWVTTIGP